ncbi:MAG: hypothetical protein ACXABY_32570 [Candidatus Thorarchaeota archaeon]|jgi:hypothetical protein
MPNGSDSRNRRPFVRKGVVLDYNIVQTATGQTVDRVSYWPSRRIRLGQTFPHMRVRPKCKRNNGTSLKLDSWTRAQYVKKIRSRV